MHIDYTLLLLHAIRTSYAELSDAEFARLAGVYAEWCPPNHGAVITSPIAFQLASLLSKKKGVRVEPIEVANKLLDVWDANAELEISIGAMGHLNAVPSELYVRKFLEKIFELGSGSLFSGAAIAVRADQMKMDDRLQGLAIDRSSIAQLRKRGAASSDSDLKQFDILLERKGESATKSDLLMYLALLGDNQIEIFSYLSGHSSSENIPWYLERFSSDWGRFILLCDERLAAVQINSTAGVDYGVDWQNRISGWSIAYAEQLRMKQVLGFREILYRANRAKRAEILLSYLLRVIKDFYHFYNHPEVRALRGELLGQKETLQITRNLLQTCGDLLGAGLELIFPPELWPDQAQSSVAQTRASY